jgi:hypothetical protein
MTSARRQRDVPNGLVIGASALIFRDRPLHEGVADTRALVGGVDGDHVDLARPGGVLVDEADSDETHRTIVDERDPDVVL